MVASGTEGRTCIRWERLSAPQSLCPSPGEVSLRKGHHGLSFHQGLILPPLRVARGWPETLHSAPAPPDGRLQGQWLCDFIKQWINKFAWSQFNQQWNSVRCMCTSGGRFSPDTVQIVSAGFLCIENMKSAQREYHGNPHRKPKEKQLTPKA